MQAIENMKFKLNILAGDIFGGLTSAIIALPQALAFGVSTGFGAGAGIWGAILLCFFAGIFGSKTPIISGTTGPSAIAIAIMMLSVNNDLRAGATIILMAGIFQVIGSLTNLPRIVKYVPYPVISGFMNGVGTIIIILQLNPILGHKTLSSTDATLINLKHAIMTYNHDALLIGALTLFIVFATPKIISKIIPSQILALIICTIVSIKLGLHIDRISQITATFPHLVMPYTHFTKIIEFIPYATTLTIIFSAESLLTGLVTDSLTKTTQNPKRIIATQGLGNLFCGITGSLGGSAATMRTVVALNSGATTKLAAIINPVILIMLLFHFTGFVAQIPLAVLAGILIKIGFDILDTKLLKVLKYAPKDDLYVLFLVFFLTVFYNLIFAVGAGITLASLLYAIRVADKAQLVHKKVCDSDILNMERILEKDYQHKIRIVHIMGQFFFGSATQLVSKFDEFLGTEYLILSYDSNDLLDISAIFALEDMIYRLKSQHISVILVIKNNNITEQLKSLSILSQIDGFFYNEEEAIKFAKSKLQLHV